jgi:ribonuclease Z
MSSGMTIDYVNGISGDPAVVIGIPNYGSSVLFDAGTLEKLTAKELLRIRTICVSHAHVDHFIGFDRIIRVNIPHFRTIDVVGPAGIADQVRAKLLAYTWNLLEANQINYRVHEVHPDGTCLTFSISSNDHFLKNLTSETRSKDDAAGVTIPLFGEEFVVSAIVLDHGTAVCGFSLKLPDSFAVSNAAIECLGIAPGAWIGDLQKMATYGEIAGSIDLPGGVRGDAVTLANSILTRRRGEQITYVTDIVFSSENLSRLKSVFSGSDTLICEANFRDEHRGRAAQKKHLTTKQAALIAVSLGCRVFEIFHLSNIYANDFDRNVREAAEFFETLRGLDPEALIAEINAEFA